MIMICPSQHARKELYLNFRTELNKGPYWISKMFICTLTRGGKYN